MGIDAMNVAALDLDEIPMAEVIPPRFEEASQLLDRAIRSGCQDAQVHYLLALACKRQGKIPEARTAFRKIQPPDANVFLQLGLLSLDEEQYEQAEQEFARALELDTSSHAACFNLLMTRLTQGKLAEASAVISQAVRTAPSAEEEHGLILLRALLDKARPGSDGQYPRLTVDDGPQVLKELPPVDEFRLLDQIRSLGDAEASLALLRPLRDARWASGAVQEAYVEAVVARARLLMDHCDWLEAERLLSPLAREPSLLTVPKPLRAAFFNLLGCCSCLSQDFESGARHFAAALTQVGNDPRIHQNLALAQEWLGHLDRADPHWNRFLDLLDACWPAPPDAKNHHERVAFETLVRLSTCWSEKEKWVPALEYAERAQRVRPNDPDVLERLFHLYQQNKKTGSARRTLVRLRELRPNEPQYELYELDFIEVKSLNDVDRMLTEIDEILRRHPGDVRVDERAVNMVSNVVPLLGNLCDQLTDQMSRVIDQVRRLPNYQVNWRAVHDVMGDLRREFNKLRRIAHKCLPLVRNDEHRRIVRDLVDHIERKIEVCQQMGG
jgi:Flp pilus assembly protein TadD